MPFQDLHLVDLSGHEKMKDPSSLSEVSNENLELDGRDVKEPIDNIRLESL